MPRFYCPPPLPHGGLFELPPDAAHHAGRVLRLREGSRVEIFDGLGNACHGVIAELGSKRVVIGEITADNVNRESPLQIMLAQALSSSEKMDWVVQKATELGVTEIQAIDTERSVAKLSAERAAKRLHHWYQVAISACEQCGRNLLPTIHAPLDIRVWLLQMSGHGDSATENTRYRVRSLTPTSDGATSHSTDGTTSHSTRLSKNDNQVSGYKPASGQVAGYPPLGESDDESLRDVHSNEQATKFILLPQGAASLHAQAKPRGKVVLLVGAEGGFTKGESESALSCGFTPISMGARVLRTETAAIAGLAALQTLWGDFC